MGIPINEDTCLYTLQFADDQVIRPGDKDDLEYMTRKLKEEYQVWGLGMNIAKTKYLCTGSDQTAIKLDNEYIQTCNEYKYLGVTFDKSGKDDNEISSRIVKARNAIKCLNNILWSNEIGNDRKLRINDATVKNNLLFGAKTWRLTENNKRKLLAVEMDAIRRLARTSKLDRVRNETFRDKMGRQKNIVEEIESAQLKWYRHVRRMDNTRLPQKELNWLP
ncbi:uncharacterized protein LOC115889832 [Sitophilus oryzae]|uniref:Uncharacterized protein LOC115889832 n=1 Tax=Sitophilus oryzae TaxID=7048 RepID=A0A6J2YR31_SITOR|nr:uncharacterized protein LOC115889832 [Sitophilus oryzae]